MGEQLQAQAIQQIMQQNERLLQAHRENMDNVLKSIEQTAGRHERRQDDVFAEFEIEKVGLDSDLVVLFNQFRGQPAWQVMLGQLQMIRLLNRILAAVSK